MALAKWLYFLYHLPGFVGVKPAYGVRRRSESGARPLGPNDALRADISAAETSVDFPELECVRSLLPSHVIDTAAARAAVLGTGADRVLIAGGTIDEETYLRALADQLGVTFEPLDGVPRATCPIADERLLEAAAQGMVPLLIAGKLVLAVAPRAAAARRIAVMIEGNPRQAQHLRFTTAERLTRFAVRCAGHTATARAAEGLKRAWPQLSAAPPRWHGNMNRQCTRYSWVA